MPSIKIAHHNPSIVVPKFDEELKNYFMNKGYGVWVLDCTEHKVVWGNKPAPGIWGFDTMEEFIGTDLCLGNKAAHEAVHILALECLQKEDMYIPFVLNKFNSDPPVDCVVRMSAIDVSGNAYMLVEVHPSFTALNIETAGKFEQEQAIDDSVCSQIALTTHQAFGLAPSIMTICSADGELKYVNLRARLYYQQVFPELDTAMSSKVNMLKQIMNGRDGKGTAYEKLMDTVMNGETFLEQIQVPPYIYGCEVWHTISACKIGNSDGGSALVVVSQVDSTENVLKDRKLAKMEQRRKQEQKDRLVEAVGHELRTPLVGVIGLSDELMTNKVLKAVIEEYKNRLPELKMVLRSIAMIHQSGQRLITIVNKLLDLSRMKKEELELDWQYVDLRKTIDIACTHSPVTSAVKLSIDMPSDMPLITADRNGIQNVFDIIYGNAVKFTKSGHINIKVQNRIQGKIGCIVVAIEDTGIGIHSDDHERVFELFEQGDNSSSRVYQGAGIGLHLAKQIIVHHGGNIFLQSEPTKGSTFTFSIPNRPETLREGSTSPTKDHIQLGVHGNNFSAFDELQETLEILRQCPSKPKK